LRQLLFLLGEDTLTLVEGGFAFVQFALRLGLVLLVETLLDLFIDVGVVGLRAVAREEQHGAGEDGGKWEDLHSLLMGCGPEGFNSKEYSTASPATAKNRRV